MTDVRHRVAETNGIRMRVAEAGSGPLVVLLHGFPEGWYSWRHQLSALAQAGFHAVAPDQRGYGETDRPPEVTQYTILHLVGDVVGLLDALEAERAVAVGPAWGAPGGRVHGVVASGWRGRGRRAECPLPPARLGRAARPAPRRGGRRLLPDLLPGAWGGRCGAGPGRAPHHAPRVVLGLGGHAAT